MMVASLFDTYGSAIRNVLLDVKMIAEDGAVLANHQIYINGSRSWEHRLLGNEDDLDQCHRIDNAEVLRGVVAAWESVANPDMSSQAESIKSFFTDDITSAEAAREIARKAAPGLDSWVRAKLLSSKAEVAGKKAQCRRLRRYRPRCADWVARTPRPFPTLVQ